MKIECKITFKIESSSVFENFKQQFSDLFYSSGSNRKDYVLTLIEDDKFNQLSSFLDSNNVSYTIENRKAIFSHKDNLEVPYFTVVANKSYDGPREMYNESLCLLKDPKKFKYISGIAPEKMFDSPTVLTRSSIITTKVKELIEENHLTGAVLSKIYIKKKQNYYESDDLWLLSSNTVIYSMNFYKSPYSYDIPGLEINKEEVETCGNLDFMLKMPSDNFQRINLLFSQKFYRLWLKHFKKSGISGPAAWTPVFISE